VVLLELTTLTNYGWENMENPRKGFDIDNKDPKVEDTYEDAKCA
jgi:hypothetical protein